MPRVSSPAPVQSRSSSPHPLPPSSSFTLQIAPAHAISDFALPSTLEVSEPEDAEQGSSEEDSRPVEVVENVRFANSTTKPNTTRRLSIRQPHSREASGSNTTSSGTGTGTGSFSQPASSTLPPPRRSISLTASEHERKGGGGFFSSIAGLFRGGSSHSGSPEKWKTRTETNLRSVRRDVDSDSEDEAPTESPTRRFFGRRSSHDTPRPPPPAATKLRKRVAPEEKDKDQGWISDGAAVRGRGARKGSARKRSALQNVPSRPSQTSAPTSAHSRSSSVASLGLSTMSAPGSSTPTRAKPSPKSKPNLRVEAIARSSADISRQSSMRSTGSAPPAPRRPSTEGRASGLPASSTTPASGVARKGSLSHGKSGFATHSSAPPYPHADAGRAGSSQLSLMAIVEGVTRDNRTAWDRAGAGLPPDPAGGSKVGGLLSVRAPPSVTKYNVRGEGGQGISFESVLAPGSVLATPPPPPQPASAPSSSAKQRQPRPSSLPPPPPRLSMPAAPAGTPPKVPLRSALRNPSPPPVPPPKPIVIPSAPPRVSVEPASAQTPNRRDRNEEDADDGSDSGSIASFRTVRESLEEGTPPTPTPTRAPAPAMTTSILASSSSLAVHGQGQGESDVSAESTSGGTKRRKSVRVSLKPTFSPTPPALDEDEDEIWKRSGRPEPLGHDAAATAAANDDGGVKVNGRERDFWADSSDEDEEYSKARKMLTRASKKRW